LRFGRRDSIFARAPLAIARHRQLARSTLALLMSGSNLYRVAVVGPRRGGKSSVVKRIVTHRFDNLPTRNAEFMGHHSDGKYVNLIAMPPAFGKLGGSGAGEVLLEMQDQLAADPGSLLGEKLWYDVEEDEATGAGDGSNSKMLATASADAEAADGIENNTEHWTKKVDPRAAKQAAAAAAAGHVQGRIPEKEPHPLMQTSFAEEARRSTAAKAADDGVNPMTRPHGTHGFLVVFDLADEASFVAAMDMVQRVVERVGYTRASKKAMPVALVLVGNKYDLVSRGKGSAVTPARLCEFLASYTQPGELVKQLRKQRVDRALYKLCDAIVADRRRVEDSWATEGATVDSEDGQKTDIGGISTAVNRTLLKLKSELDPMRVTRSSGGTSEVELFTAIFACLEHPLAEKSDVPPMDIFEALFSCPAVGVKYVEVSCKTNHQVHLLERTVLRAVRLLASPDGQQQRRKAKGASKEGPGAFDALKQAWAGVWPFGADTCGGRKEQPAVAVS